MNVVNSKYSISSLFEDILYRTHSDSPESLEFFADSGLARKAY
jgi:hypothetical protein